MVARIKAKVARQEELDSGMQIPTDMVVDILWLDACFHMNVKELELARIDELLCPTHTFGKVVAQNNNTLVVATNSSAANGIDLIAIPIRWIQEITMLR
ncbi:MAG: hypothetical protein ABH828_02280 [archaeon]